jgi:hypothetical protein
MSGNGIPIPDAPSAFALPEEAFSNAPQFSQPSPFANLRVQPQPSGPTLSPDQSIAELEQNRLQTIQNPAQYQPDFQQQPQFEQPQLPQGPDQFTPFEQQIQSRIDARRVWGMV